MLQTNRTKDPRSLKDIQDELERLDGVMCILEVKDNRYQTGVIVNKGGAKPDVGLRFQFDAQGEPIEFDTPVDHSPEETQQHEATIATLHALEEELRSRPGTQFNLLWSVGGGDSNLITSSDEPEEASRAVMRVLSLYLKLIFKHEPELRRELTKLALNQTVARPVVHH